MRRGRAHVQGRVADGPDRRLRAPSAGRLGAGQHVGVVQRELGGLELGGVERGRVELERVRDPVRGELLPERRELLRADLLRHGLPVTSEQLLYAGNAALASVIGYLFKLLLAERQGRLTFVEAQLEEQKKERAAVQEMHKTLIDVMRAQRDGALPVPPPR